jgi:hypothetical protein
MRILTITLIMVLISTLCSAGIYKWVDENGRIHFSDKPQNIEAHYYIPETGSPTFEGGSEAQKASNSSSSDSPSAKKLTYKEYKKIQKENIEKSREKAKEDREKYAAGAEERDKQLRKQIRNSPEYKKLLRKKKRASKAQKRYPNAPHNTRLTLQEEMFLSKGRDNNKLEELLEKANKK